MMCNNNSNRHSDNVDTWSHITGKLLSTWIQDKNINILTIDSRNINDYNQSHIKNSINIPSSTLLKRNLIEDKTLITELLIKNSNINEYYNNFKIVVYDTNSEHTNQLEYDSFVIILIKKLAQKFKSVSFLIGGFMQFKLHYSYLCVPGCNNNNNNNNVNTQTNNNSLNKKQFSMNHNENTASVNDDLNSSRFLVNNKKALLSLPTTTSNMLHHHTITVPASSLRSTVPIVSSRTSAAAAFNESISNNTNPYNNEITQILPYLYLGSENDALSEEKMNRLNIKYVLNVSQHSPKPKFIEDGNFLRIPIDDSHCAKLLPYFETAFKFIEKCRKSNSNILIHCLAGISRSPTLAIAYIMKSMNKSFNDAYDFVKKRRPSISPNFNFLGQLIDYEKNKPISTSASNQQQQSPPSSAKTTTSTTHSSLIASGINASCQALLTITKATITATSKDTEKTDFNKSKLNLTQSVKTKKPFIFNLNQNNNQFNEQDNVKLTVNPVHSRTLQSPCQALANFNFNSPKSEKSINELFEETSSDDHLMNKNNNNNNENSICGLYPGVKFRNKYADNHNIESTKYMPKSLTIDSLNESDNNNNKFNFKQLLPNKQMTTKRSATENCEIDEQENIDAADTDTNKNENMNLNKKHTLIRPSSIFINRQLLTIKETLTNISSSCSSASSIISSTTSPYLSNSSVTPTSASSISSTTSSCCFNQNQNEIQLDSNNKKMKLSPITDINPILSSASASSSTNKNKFYLNSNQSTNKSKSSENLCFDFKTNSEILNLNPTTTTTTSNNNENFCFLNNNNNNNNQINRPTNLNLLSDSKSFETIKSLTDDNTIIKSQSSSTKSSKSSLHGSIEKMIEVS